MNIAAHLLCAKPPQQVAQMFIKLLQQNSHAANALCLEIALELPQTIFIVIGFPCAITPAQVRDNSYKWPNTLPLYTFPFNAMLFRPLATFLTHMSRVVQQQIEDKVVDCSALTYYIELLDVWYNIYKDLEEQDGRSISRRFEEPLARVNFCLLLGLHPLRKMYRCNFQQLDEMCDRLYRSAVKGIFYIECHLDVVEGLSLIFSQDFHIFCQHAPNSLNFFYDALSVVNQKQTYIKIYQLLAKMLQDEEENWTPNQMLILTNFLIEQKMQQVYFSNLKFGKTKRLLMAVLEFLKILQSKLPTVDCFSKPFIEALWPLMLNKDFTIATLAADVYVLIMRRKFNDHLVVKHIMEGYYSTTNTTDMLSYYITTLWSIFPVLCNVNEYVEVIKSARTCNTFRSYAAYFLFYVFRQMFQDFVKYREQLEYLLLLIPNLLEELTCQVTSGILLQIYDVLSFDDLKNNTPKADEILSLFEKYIFETFTVASYEYPLMVNLFGQLYRCLSYSHHWFKLEKISVIIYNKYRKIEQSLNDESFSLNTLRDYNTSLQKLSLLLTTGYDILYDNLVGIVVRIRERLISKPQINEFVARTNCFMDVYAIDILTLALIKLATATNITEHDKKFIKTLTQQLTKYLLTFIKNVEDLSNMPVVRIKTIFCSFVELHCLFHGKSLIDQMKFTPYTYFLLVETLILINFNTKHFCCDGNEQMHTHPLRNLEYQVMIFEKFIKLHDSENVEIPTNVAWKLCIYYGLPGHKFNAQLAALLKTIASKHPRMYKHILPVLVYNLYKRRPTLNDHAILQAIKAHRKLINTELKLENPHVIKVHIVLTVLQIVNKSVQILQLNSIVNRLRAIKHLSILVEDIKWTDKSVLEMILKQANEIKANLLTPFEVKALQNFMEFFEKQKT